jgi:hypothetical protein
VREPHGGPCGVYAQGLALDEPVVVADLYDLRQREVGSQLTVLRPRDPEHARGLKVGLELRERIVELRPVLRPRVSLGSEARQLEFTRS